MIVALPADARARVAGRGLQSGRAYWPKWRNPVSEMQTVKVNIGAVWTVNGCVQDNLRPVEFEGALLASRWGYTGDDNTRGVAEFLYRTGDGRLIVYVEEWSRWQGEPNTYTLHEVSEDALEVGGEYEWLGREAGFGRPLTLDEALAQAGPELE